MLENIVSLICILEFFPLLLHYIITYVSFRAKHVFKGIIVSNAACWCLFWEWVCLWYLFLFLFFHEILLFILRFQEIKWKNKENNIQFMLHEYVTQSSQHIIALSLCLSVFVLLTHFEIIFILFFCCISVLFFFNEKPFEARE